MKYTTSSTAPSRWLSSAPVGISSESRRSRIVRFARTSRCAMAVSSERNARAISRTLKPPTVLRLRATLVSRDNSGWQHIEDHAQFVVAQLLGNGGVFGRGNGRPRHLQRDRLALVAQQPSVAERVDGDVIGDAEEPGGRILGQTVLRPRLHGAQHGVLDTVFGYVQMRRPEHTRQMGHHAPRLMTEQVLQKHAGLGPFAHSPQVWRTSIVPPYSRCG